MLTTSQFRSQVPTIEQYLRALESVKEYWHENHYKMLRIHFASDDCTTTATRLALAVGYEHFGGANLQYGKLGEMLCNELSLRLKWHVNVIADFGAGDENDPHLQWIMWNPLRQALVLSGLMNLENWAK